ncbi:MAG: AAA family ATPase [Verrucomicrobia bacterium]|nr:AAA family ATPase [Verrucomicrobiota bacterium]MCH8512254.1 ATP-binding protein [Kiritimatiellia bacterium]
MKRSTSPILALHEISLYNTGRISPEKIIAAFAARKEQFQRIMADLSAEKLKSRPQHHLIVGQRGMGKTMLLARISAELRTEPALSERFIPLVFAEEQYAVDRLSKFWLNCLDSLADAREAAKDGKAVAEIDAVVARLQNDSVQAAKDDQPFADEVYAAFAKAAQANGQRPVLLVDNLQLVFERLDQGQQHSLRELLMRAGAPILVGASPSPPPQSQDYGAAFYDQFKVHYLRPLSEEEMRNLLLHIATAARREDIRHRVLQFPQRLKILHQLTGGNPRTTITLFFLYAEDFSPSVFGDLEGLLDRVTPLYKARFEELTPQQQVIVSAMANHWDPITAAGIASATGMAVDASHATRTHARHHTTANLASGTISAQLDRLEKIGIIERTELFNESRTGYLIAERFFNIWFLMRNASRRQRREVEFLTRFLENFYEPAERSRIARQLEDELLTLPKNDLPDTTHLHKALFAAYDSNWGLVCDELSKALALRTEGFVMTNTDDWLRASAVLIHLNYGADLIRFLDQLGNTTSRLRPWVEALRALQIGDKRALQNIAPEIRGTAEIFYDGMEKRLLKLPESTRRRPIDEPKRKLSRRK